MKKLILLCSMLCLATMHTAFAQTDIAVEMHEVWQECDSMRFNFVITDSSNAADGFITAKIKNSFGTVIASNTVLYAPPQYDHYSFMHVVLPEEAFGSHTCIITAQNTDGETGTSDSEDIDIVSCNLGIENLGSQWCLVHVISQSVLITLANAQPTTVFIFDIHGKEIMQTQIFDTTLLPFDVSVGIYSVVVQQNSSTKIFKLAVTD